MRLTWILRGRLAASGMIRRSDVADLEELGISSVLSLTLRSPFPNGAPDGISHLHLPVPDMSCPPHTALVQAVTFLHGALESGGKGLVHCGAGFGRTGTVIACYLVARGMAPLEAIDAVRSARPGSIETREQERGIVAFARQAMEDDHE